MKNLIKIVFGFMTVIFIVTGCSSKTYSISIHEKLPESYSDKRVVLFLDGTHNDLKSRTNVAKLFNIIDAQELDNLHIFYNEGVGVGSKVLGMGTGLGFGKDVCEAYEFLSLHYEQGSKLYIFGFSRGAYTARILAGMLDTVGLYNLKKLDEFERNKIIKHLYTRIYKGNNKSKESIREDAKEYIEYLESQVCQGEIFSHTVDCGIHIDRIYSDDKKTIKIPVEIMGIWDTVEALSTDATKEAIDDKTGIKKDQQIIVKPNPKYYESLCNINHVLHALALDDNRAYVFTPIIMSSKKYVESCDDGKLYDVSKIVNEVWFSGAHTDVGGGGYFYEYSKGDEDMNLPGVSMNWMIDEINKIDNKLIPNNTKVYENYLGYIHNSEEGLSMFYRDKTRNDILTKYAKESVYDSIKIHSSVLKRLENKKSSLKNEYDSKWYCDEFFKDCFDINNKDEANKSIVYKNCEQIESDYKSNK